MGARLSVVSLALVACTAAAAEGGDTIGIDTPLAPNETVAAAGWTLTWSDEFDTDGATDPTKWIVWEGDRHHDHVLNSSSRDALEQKGGSLFVSALETPDDPDFPYTTGYISTQGTFAQTYGKVEFRLRGEFAPGLWYAVWGRPWASNAVPEVDVEFLAENPTQVWFIDHWALPPIAAADRRRFTTVNGFDFTQWHTYAITWTPTLIEWLIDGQAYMRMDEDKGIAHEPMFWTINAWVGGWAGVPTENTKLPSHFEVDYLRVYRPATWLTDPQIRVSNPSTSFATNETINLAVADFDPGTRVEVWEGSKLLTTLTAPPFKYRPTTAGAHSFTFRASDGRREASTDADVDVIVAD